METTTYSVGTKDWKAAIESRGLVLYDAAMFGSGQFTWVSTPSEEKTDETDDRLFGSHLREAAATVKKLFGS